MKMGKWELVSGCGRELWLNPPPPSLWRLHRSLDGMRHSGTTQRAWHQTDSKTWYLIFLSRADTNSALHLLFSHACSERRSCAEKKKKEGETRPGRSSPRCSCGSFAFNSNNLRIVFMTEDKDVPLVRTLFDWKKSLTPERLQIKPEEHDCMCMQLYLSISAWM